MNETCYICLKSFPVAGTPGYENDFGYRYDSGWRDDKSKVTVSFTTDPFNVDIYGDETLHWICNECAHERYMDI